MSTLNEAMLKQASRKLKLAISKFCRARVNAGICEPDECDMCACNKAYEMAEVYTEEETEEE